MESHVSPLVKFEQAPILKQTLLDDPYAYITYLEPLTRHEFYYINGKIENGWITGRDIDIVKFVFVHRWVTLSQLARLFFPATEREATVRNRVRKLIKYGLLRKIPWSSYSSPTENRPSYYELGASGADILKYRFGAFLGHRDPRNPKETTMLFRMKYVVTNELYVQVREVFDLIHFEFHPILKMNDEQQIPTAKYTLRNPRGKDVTFYLLCHREDEKWIKTIRYQAQFYKKYLTTVEKGAILVVIVSTDEKAELAGKILEQEGILPQITWFVIDEDLHNKQMKLTQCFFSFQNGKKSYYDLS